MYVQAPPNPQLSRALKDAEKHLNAYYRETPVPEGWEITGIFTGTDEVWVDLSLPRTEAERLVINGFFRDVLDAFSVEAARNEIQTLIDQKILSV